MANNIPNQQHSIESCSCPNYLVKCSDCLVFSMDGSGHAANCERNGTKTSIEKCIYAKLPMPMFKFRLDNGQDSLHLLNKETGIFVPVNNNTMIHAHEVNGAFGVQEINGKTVITFSATTVNRFSVAMAFLVNGIWRLRYRFVMTLNNGILGFPLFKTFAHQNDTYNVPAEFYRNTVAIFGIAPSEMESTVSLRVYANELGLIGDEFNGYNGNIKFDAFNDRVTPSETLKPLKYGKIIRFDKNAYQMLPTQTLIEDLDWCENCMNSVRAIPHFNSDISVKMPMPLFTLQMQNPSDKLHLFDITAGKFVEVEGNLVTHAHAVNGIFCIDKTEIKFMATSLKNLELIVAYERNGIFGMKYAFVQCADGLKWYLLDLI